MAHENRARGRLSREVLVATALEIADREGLEALSMRRLGAELGVDATAAYRHLPGKKDLLAGVVESVLAGADVETDRRRRGRSSSGRGARVPGRSARPQPGGARVAATLPIQSLETPRRRPRHREGRPGDVPLATRRPHGRPSGQLTTGLVRVDGFWRAHAVRRASKVYLYPTDSPARRGAAMPGRRRVRSSGHHEASVGASRSRGSVRRGGSAVRPFRHRADFRSRGGVRRRRPRAGGGGGV